MQIPQQRPRPNQAAGATDDEPPEGLEDAAHVIVVQGPLRAPAPEGFDGADVLAYEMGDELPLEAGLQAFEGWPTRLALLDADGNHIAGGERNGRSGVRFLTDDAPDRLTRDHDVEAAIEQWEAGDGFGPSENQEAAT